MDRECFKRALMVQMAYFDFSVHFPVLVSKSAHFRKFGFLHSGSSPLLALYCRCLLPHIPSSAHKKLWSVVIARTPYFRQLRRKQYN